MRCNPALTTCLAVPAEMLMEIPPVGPGWKEELGVAGAGLAGGLLGGLLCGGPPLAIPYVGPFLAAKGGAACAVALSATFAGGARLVANAIHDRPDVWKGVAYSGLSTGLGAGVAVATPLLGTGARLLTRVAYGTGAGTLGGVGTEVAATAISERDIDTGLARACDGTVWLTAGGFALAGSLGAATGKSLMSKLREHMTSELAAGGNHSATRVASAAVISEMASAMDNATAQLLKADEALAKVQTTDELVELVNSWHGLNATLTDQINSIVGMRHEALFQQVLKFDQALDQALGKVRELVGDAAPAYGAQVRTGLPVMEYHGMTPRVHPDIAVPQTMAHVQPEHIQRLMELDSSALPLKGWGPYLKRLDKRLAHLTQPKPTPPSLGDHPERIARAQLFDNVRAELYDKVRLSLGRSGAEPVAWPDGFKPLEAIDDVDELAQRIQALDDLEFDVSLWSAHDAGDAGSYATSQEDADHFDALIEQIGIYLDMARNRMLKLDGGGAPAGGGTPTTTAQAMTALVQGDAMQAIENIARVKAAALGTRNAIVASTQEPHIRKTIQHVESMLGEQAEMLQAANDPGVAQAAQDLLQTLRANLNMAKRRLNELKSWSTCDALPVEEALQIHPVYSLGDDLVSQLKTQRVWEHLSDVDSLVLEHFSDKSVMPRDVHLQTLERVLGRKLELADDTTFHLLSNKGLLQHYALDGRSPPTMQQLFELLSSSKPPAH